MSITSTTPKGLLQTKLMEAIHLSEQMGDTANKQFLKHLLTMALLETEDEETRNRYG